MSNIIQHLSKIQASLIAPKGQKNDFGKYAYRSCEDILAAVKPILSDLGATILLSDSIELIGDRYYVKATATLYIEEETTAVSAYAREALNKKGMDESQITGACSSYARKYALNGLLAIDGTKDADTRDNRPDPIVVISKKEQKEIYTQVAECIINEDKPGITEIMAPYSNEEKLFIWQLFNSEQRSYMKAMKK